MQPQRGAGQRAMVWSCCFILGEFGLFYPALLVKRFPDCRNVSVEQCRTVAVTNNSQSKQPWQKLSMLVQIFLIFFPFLIQAIADLIYLEDELRINLILETAGNDVIMKY